MVWPMALPERVLTVTTLLVQTADRARLTALATPWPLKVSLERPDLAVAAARRHRQAVAVCQHEGAAVVGVFGLIGVHRQYQVPEPAGTGAHRNGHRLARERAAAVFLTLGTVAESAAGGAGDFAIGGVKLQLSLTVPV